MMINELKVKQEISCKYPQHGKRNILCRQIGTIVNVGQKFITIERTDGTYRTLRFSRMVDVQVLESVWLIWDDVTPYAVRGCVDPRPPASE